MFRSLICAGALALLMVSPALSGGDKANGGNGNHWGWGNGKGGGVSHSAPGPELGVGLPALLIGGYLWYRRRSPQAEVVLYPSRRVPLHLRSSLRLGIGREVTAFAAIVASGELAGHMS